MPVWVASVMLAWATLYFSDEVEMNHGSFDINKNHRLYFDDAYHAMPLLSGSLPMVEDYLEALHKVIYCALDDHGRVFAFRVDLRLPDDLACDEVIASSAVVSRFMESLKAKIKHNRKIAKKNGGLVHDTRVRYFWVREIGCQGKVHYHFVVLLNGHAYNWLGDFRSANRNMANRVWEAWSSALGIAVEDAKPLAHFPETPSYMLHRGDPETVATFFQRASYLCKARTKQYGSGHHGYGASRG